MGVLGAATPEEDAGVAVLEEDEAALKAGRWVNKDDVVDADEEDEAAVKAFRSMRGEVADAEEDEEYEMNG